MTERRHIDSLPLGGDGLPYSKGLLARSLIAIGVARVHAYELALRVEAELRATSSPAMALERLHELAVDVLGGDAAERAIRRLHLYEELRTLDLPVIVLVGGATGAGKSTIATEIAHRLGITRVTSTDFIRQTMRAFFSREFMPSIHYSSFEVGEALPPQEREAGDPLLVGFIDQARHVLVGVNAAIERAIEEGWSMVLEGIHVVPGMLTVPSDRALVVQVIVAIENEDVHAQHFFIRDTVTGGVRALDRYLGRLADIRQLQDFIVDEAQKAGVPVVQNGNIEAALSEVMDLVLARLTEVPRV